MDLVDGVVKVEAGFNIGTIYQRVGDQFFSMEIPNGWESRYINMNGIDQHNMILFRLPEDVGSDSTSPNSISVQYLDRDAVIEFDPQTYSNAEAAVNPGGKTHAKKSDFNGLPGIVTFTQKLPFKVDKGEVSCEVWTVYFQYPKNLKLFRISFWYDKTKEKKFKPLFEHMLASFKLK